MSEKKKKNNRVRNGADPECWFSYKFVSVSDAKVNQIIDALIVWMNSKEKKTSVLSFIRSQNLSSTSYYQLLEKHPKLKEVHEEAKRIIGEQLYSDAVYNRANWNAIHFRLHNYSEEFREAKIYNAKLNRDLNNDTNINIHIPEFKHEENE